MPTSFVVGYTKVLAGTEPRFMVLTGDEPALKAKIVEVLNVRPDVEPHYLVAADSGWYVCGRFILFSQATRTSCQKRITLTCGTESYREFREKDFDWLPVWFNTVRRSSIVIPSGVGPDLAGRLEKKANSRGIVIDCSAPTGDQGRSKLVTTIAEWYGQSKTQVNILLSKNDWQITECMQLLDKLAALNMPLNSDTAMKLGLAFPAREEFVKTLTNNSASLAMAVIPRIEHSDYQYIVTELTSWLDRVTRVKLANVWGKTINDVAFETGETKASAEVLLRQSRLYDLTRLNKLALVLANADRDIAHGHKNGVLEVMVTNW